MWGVWTGSSWLRIGTDTRCDGQILLFCLSFVRKGREIAIPTWTYHIPGSNGKTSGKLLGQMKMERDVQLVSISLQVYAQGSSGPVH